MSEWTFTYIPIMSFLYFISYHLFGFLHSRLPVIQYKVYSSMNNEG